MIGADSCEGDPGCHQPVSRFLTIGACDNIVTSNAGEIVKNYFIHNYGGESIGYAPQGIMI